MNVAMLTCESDRSKACEAAVAKARAMTSTASRAACDVAASIDSPGPSLLLASTHSPVASVGTRNGVSRATIATRWGRAAADGDDDTQLSASQVEGMVEGLGSLDLEGDLDVSGTAVFNDSVSANDGMVVNGELYAPTQTGPYGYLEFTTNRVASDASNNVPSYTLLDMRCSGHWGSYFVEIDLITFYYRPSVVRYEYYCGNGNHTSGGTLVEVQAPQAIGALVSLTKTSPIDTGYDHSNIRMYDVQLKVNQSAYVQSYARVRVYGYWPSYKAGGAHSNTSPSAIWPTWTQ